MVSADKWEWNIEAVNPVEYILKLTLHTENRLLKTIFKKSVKKLEKKKGIVITDDTTSLDSFKIDPRFYKLIKTIIRSMMKTVQEDEKVKDNIAILSYDVKGGEFVRNKKDKSLWDINLTVEGQYSEK